MSGKSKEPVEITLHIRNKSTEKAQAFWQGELDDAGKEIWVWLAKSQILSTEEKQGDVRIVTIPEWLALEKGLI